MCLIVNIERQNGQWMPDIKKADHNITCYKVVTKYTGEYKTPIIKARIPDIVMKGFFRFKAEGDSLYKKKYRPLWARDNRKIEYIYGGVIHTFVDLKDAIDYMDHCRKYIPQAEVWKCHIPKGVWHVTGTDVNDYPCYGSESIRFVEKLYESMDTIKVKTI